MKTCSKCKQAKELAAFNKDLSKPDGLHSHCKQCHSDRWNRIKNDPELRAKRSTANRNWRQANPERFTKGVRCATLRKKYGLSSNDFDLLLADQGGGCAICGSLRSLGNGSLHVDHDHVTGKVRGILCQPCNTGLGKFRDRQDLLLRAVSYLKGE